MAESTRMNGTSDKLPYTVPKLTIHGDLQSITAAKGGTRTEIGQPKTFNISLK